MIGVPLSDDWRLEHVKFGDQAMVKAYTSLAEMDEATDEKLTDVVATVNVMIQAAQAHYLAANIRAKPQTSVQIHGHDWPVK